MTRKHFAIIAEVIRHSADYYKSNPAHAAAAAQMADRLAAENPRFDRARFLTACMPSEYVGARSVIVRPWRHAGADV